MALTFADKLGTIDLAKMFKLCIVHDLGEAIHGDVPAVEQVDTDDKSGRERQDLQELSKMLPRYLQDELLGLWEDYELAHSREARIVKALDKLETIIQHNQGANPPDFDYAFNLDYGKKYTEAEPLLAEIRPIVDADTKRNAEK
jgi:putative hydrolase of HD superfamily